MRSAPPVAVRCTAGPAWRVLQGALPALAAGVLIFWGLSTWADGVSAPLHYGLPLVSALAIGMLAWWHSGHEARTLAWDGQEWTLDGRPGELQLMVDLGGALLLRHARQRWLLASRQDAGTAWHGLRVAVLARGVPSATDDGRRNA